MASDSGHWTLAVEEHRTAITEGDAAQATELCRRLLRSDDNAQRTETAYLVLDRLRSDSTGDTTDTVNALLRLLSNYVAPTRDFTEEVLALLLFSEHRVLLINHLSKVRAT